MIIIKILCNGIHFIIIILLLRYYYYSVHVSKCIIKMHNLLSLFAITFCQLSNILYIDDFYGIEKLPQIIVKK